MVMLVFVRFANVFFRVLVEGFLAAKGTEVVGLSLILGRAGGGGGVNIHVANRVVYSSCHKLSPFVWFNYLINRLLQREPYYSTIYRQFGVFLVIHSERNHLGGSYLGFENIRHATNNSYPYLFC